MVETSDLLTETIRVLEKKNLAEDTFRDGTFPPGTVREWSILDEIIRKLEK